MGANTRRIGVGAALMSAATVACSGEGDTGTTGAGESLAEHVVPPEAVQVLGTSDRIAGIRDVLPAPDGLVWVLTTGEPFVVVLSADGSLVHAWGPRGEGPRELQSPEALVPHPGTGEPWVYDRGRHALIRVSGPDEAWTDLGLPGDSVPEGRVVTQHFAEGEIGNPWITTRDGAFLLARARPESEAVRRLWNADVVAFDPGTLEARVLLPLADLLGDPAPRYGGVSMFLPYPLWSACPGGDFVLYDPLRNAVRRLSAEGEETGALPLPAERLEEITFDRLYDMVLRQMARVGVAGDTAGIRDQFEEQWPALSTQFATVFPEFTGIECLAGSSVWLQRFAVQGFGLGFGPEWLRLRDDATVAVRLPDAFESLRFTADRIWGVVRDELGIQSVAWIEMDDAEP